MIELGEASDLTSERGGESMKKDSIVSAKKIQLGLFYFRFLTMKLRLIFLASFSLLLQGRYHNKSGYIKTLLCAT